jgi:hypothetical protein
MKTIYESKVHVRDMSHDVLILEGPQYLKMKMTYECSNATERFTGELFMGQKWEHFFSMLDLGVTVDKSMYVRSEIERRNRSVELQKLGKKFFESMKN